MGVIRIYGLIDPRCGEIRYVGKTRETYARRLYGHYRDAHTKRPSPLRAWLLKLEELELTPEFVTLEEEPTDWRAAERKWIAHYRELYPGKMKNLADGGQGGNPTLSGYKFSGGRPGPRSQKELDAMRDAAKRDAARVRQKQWFVDLRSGKVPLKSGPYAGQYWPSSE